jgi:group I intron endonuclease
MEKKSGVYKITSPSGRIYIGSSVDIYRNRLKQYRSLSCKSQPRLYNSLNKYGFENHKFEIIWECEEEYLNYFEYMFGVKFNVLDSKNGLNNSLPNLGEKRLIFSDERNKKISESHKGRKRIFSDEHKRNISKSKKGKSLISQEHREKLRLKRKGKKPCSKKVIDINTGKIWLCVKDCANELDVNHHTLRYHLKKNSEKYNNLKYLENKIIS